VLRLTEARSGARVCDPQHLRNVSKPDTHGIKVKTANLMDRTDAEIAAVINPFLATDKTHWRAIQDRREAASQTIGRAIQEVCFSGLIARSQASPRSRIIVIFPKKLKTPEKLSAPRLKRMD